MIFNNKAAMHTAQGSRSLNLKLARGLWSRFRGLMLSRPLQSEPDPQGLLITRCPSVHGFFMLYSLDIVYLATDVATVETNPSPNQTYSVTHTTNLRPWSISFGKSRSVTTQQGTFNYRSAHALELPAGTVKSLGITPGDRLEVFA
jgi:uncharacterized membrane protein (UPF0127 family)